MKTKLPENLSSTLHQCQQKRASGGTKKKAENFKQRKQFFHRNNLSHTHIGHKQIKKKGWISTSDSDSEESHKINYSNIDKKINFNYFIFLRSVFRS